MTINLGPSSTGDVQSFFQLGGFNPAICSVEDDYLCQRFAFWIELAHTARACLYRRQPWNSSTNYLRVPKASVSRRTGMFSSL